MLVCGEGMLGWLNLIWGVDAWMLEFNLRGWMLGCLNFSDSNYNRVILVEINGIYSKNQIATEKHKTIGLHPRTRLVEV